jgi:hypothetical protein
MASDDSFYESVAGDSIPMRVGCIHSDIPPLQHSVWVSGNDNSTRWSLNNHHDVVLSSLSISFQMTSQYTTYFEYSSYVVKIDAPCPYLHELYCLPCFLSKFSSWDKNLTTQSTRSHCIILQIHS